MRIAFVSQPFDCVSWSSLNSVGRVTHNLAAGLAATDEVVIHANGDLRGHDVDWTAEGLPGVEYRLAHGMRLDRVVTRAWHRAAPVLGTARRGMRPPLSTSELPMRQYIRRTADRVRGERYDVIHVQHATPLLPALRRAAPESVIVVHVHAEWFPQTPRRTLASRLLHADAVVAVSDYVRDRLVDYVPEIEQRCVTVYNGVTIPTTGAAGAGASGAATSGSRRRPPFVLYVGAISPHKGLHDLVAAFTTIAARHPHVQLRLVGPPGAYPIEEVFPLDDRATLRTVRRWYGGDYLAALSALVPAELAGRVVFEGRIPEEEVAAAFRTAEVVAFTPVWDEGFGLPVTEAMVFGRPVVATRSGAVPETVVDGATGFLVDKGDVAGLASRLDRLLGDPALRARMGAAGRTRAVDLFAWPAVTGQMRELYCRTVAARTAGDRSSPSLTRF